MTELRKMRTAEEMYEYYCEIRKDVKKGESDLDTRKFFQNPLDEYKKAEVLLNPDEYCVTTFRAYIYVYMYNFERQKWVYILTNKRILTINFDLFGMESIGWDQIKHFVVRNGEFIIDANVYHRSLSEVFVDCEQDSEIIEKELEKVMPFIWEEREKMLKESNYCISTADEIRKFKELWDDGIITEEEFQQKKKKLLDL